MPAYLNLSLIHISLQIKECIQETLNPLGVMVVVEAKHMCMQMRGVEKMCIRDSFRRTYLIYDGVAALL